jgi:hypothetical protein
MNTARFGGIHLTTFSYLSCIALCSTDVQLRADGGPVRPSAQFFGAFVSGVVATFIINPIMVVKVRMTTTGTSTERAKIYTSILSTTHHIVQREGLTAYCLSFHPFFFFSLTFFLFSLRCYNINRLWKGVGPALLGVSDGMVQFAVYEQVCLFIV